MKVERWHVSSHGWGAARHDKGVEFLHANNSLLLVICLSRTLKPQTQDLSSGKRVYSCLEPEVSSLTLILTVSSVHSLQSTFGCSIWQSGKPPRCGPVTLLALSHRPTLCVFWPLLFSTSFQAACNHLCSAKHLNSSSSFVQTNKQTNKCGSLLGGGGELAGGKQILMRLSCCVGFF